MQERFYIIIWFVCFSIAAQAQSDVANDDSWLLMNRCEGVMQVFRAQEIKPEITFPSNSEFNSQIASMVEVESQNVRYKGELSILFYLKEDGTYCVSRLVQSQDAKRQLDLRAVLENVVGMEIDFEPGREDGDEVTCEMHVKVEIRKGRVLDIDKSNVTFLD